MLSNVAKALSQEYATRRAMLLKRLDVLVSTFGWSQRAAERKDEMLQRVQSILANAPPLADFTAADAFAADDTLLELQRAMPLQAGGLKRVTIGSVPDRGGRANESFYYTESYVDQERVRSGGGGKGGGGKGGRGSRRRWRRRRRRWWRRRRWRRRRRRRRQPTRRQGRRRRRWWRWTRGGGQQRSERIVAD